MKESPLKYILGAVFSVGLPFSIYNFADARAIIRERINNYPAMRKLTADREALNHLRNAHANLIYSIAESNSDPNSAAKAVEYLQSEGHRISEEIKSSENSPLIKRIYAEKSAQKVRLYGNFICGIGNGLGLLIVHKLPEKKKK